MGVEASELYPKADQYILVGDATGIPVLSAILEDLPKEAIVNAFIEVETVEDIQVLQTKANANIEWIVNASPGKSTELAENVMSYINAKQDLS